MEKTNINEIIGMRIQTRIGMNKKYTANERYELMCQIEKEIENIISVHNDLICLGGKGEWIYSDEQEDLIG